MEACIAYGHFMTGRYDEAASWARSGIRDQPHFLAGHRVAAASNALADRMEEARAAIAALREADPSFRVSNLSSGSHSAGQKIGLGWKRAFVKRVSPNDPPPTTSSERSADSGLWPSAPGRRGKMLAHLATLPRTPMKCATILARLDSPTLRAAVVQPSDATNALKKRRATSLRVRYRGSAARLFRV